MTKALNHGWELYEAPTMTFNGSQVIVGQAICKTIDENYDPEMDILDVLKIMRDFRGGIFINKKPL